MCVNVPPPPTQIIREILVAARYELVLLMLLCLSLLHVGMLLLMAAVVDG